MAAIICTAVPPSMSMAGQHPKQQSQPMPCMYRITQAAGRIHIALIGGDEPEGFVADHATMEDAENHLRGRHKGSQLTFRPE